VTDRIEVQILSQAGDNLKLIAAFGTGIYHIDMREKMVVNIKTFVDN